MQMSTKRCIGYKPMGVEPHEAPIDNFGKHSRMKDGLQPQCKSCQSVMNSSSPVKKKLNDERKKGGRTYESTKLSRQKTIDKLRAIEDEKLGYYVYEHLDGVHTMYIGKGRGDRAWSFCRSRSAHVEWLCDQAKGAKQWVRLIETNLTEEEALELEAELIREFEPPFNTVGKSKLD